MRSLWVSGLRFGAGSGVVVGWPSCGASVGVLSSSTALPSLRFFRSSAFFLRISITFRVSTSSGIASRVAVSLIYTCRLIISGITAIDSTI